jgi:hypothetical protein
MSGKITAEMISEELAKTAWKIAATTDFSKRNQYLSDILNAAIEAGLVSPPVTNWEKIYKAALNDLYEGYVEDQEAKGNRPAPLQLWIDNAQLRLGRTE